MCPLSADEQALITNLSDLRAAKCVIRKLSRSGQLTATSTAADLIRAVYDAEYEVEVELDELLSREPAEVPDADSVLSGLASLTA